MHQRNRHLSRYPMKELIQSLPALRDFVKDETIDFSNPDAVKTLNQSLLKYFYGVTKWNIPEGYLCPPIPGRADYIHHLADLISLKKKAHILDIGTGANGVYPLLAFAEYGWTSVGSDIDEAALKSLDLVLKENPSFQKGIELRLQTHSKSIFKNIIKPGEYFDLTLCNPPFHASLEEAQAGTERKWKNLGKPKSGSKMLNFGGQKAELWCEGGEKAFIAQMIFESTQYAKQVGWFTTLVSKEANLPFLYKQLEKIKTTEIRTLDMSQGQKKSRILAWKL